MRKDRSKGKVSYSTLFKIFFNLFLITLGLLLVFREKTIVVIKGKIKNQLDKLKNICIEIQQRINKGEKCKGTFEVRLYHGIPCHAYFKTEHEMLIGLYYSHLGGLQSECLRMNNRKHMEAQPEEK